MAETDQTQQNTPEPKVQQWVIDRRKSHWSQIPDYVIDQFARWIGTTAVALYLALCRRAKNSNDCYPSYDFLATQLGLSRGQIKRQMGCLIHYGLVVQQPRFKEGRQTSNLYVLVDPDEAPETKPRYDNKGGRGRARAPATGAPETPSGGAPARLTGGAPETPSGGAPARPELDPEERDPKEVCVSPTPPPTAQTVWPGETKHLVALWLNQLQGGTPNFLAQQKAEIRPVMEGLLRRGISLESLEEAILCPDRPQNEWPRQFAARFQEPASKTKTHEQRAQATAELRAREQRERDEAGRSARSARELVKQLAKKCAVNGLTATIGVAADLPPVPPKG